MARTPTVIEGARGPREARPADTRRTAGLQAVPDDKIVFQSKYGNYRLQLTNPQDIILPDGRKIPGRPLKAQFVDGMLKLDREKDEEIIKLVSGHPDQGVDFWDYQTVLDGVVERRREQAVEILRDPSDRKAIIEALRADGMLDEFEIPAGKKDKKVGGKPPEVAEEDATE